MRRTGRNFAVLATAVVTVATVGTTASAQQVSRLASMMEWSLYVDAKTPHAFCFVTSEPKASAPPDAQRETGRAYVSAWPKDGVKAEFSVRLGFSAKKGADVSAAVGTQSFKMFTTGERAFVQDATAELKLVEAMRKGTKFTITATTASGTEVSDTYSLTGMGQALQQLQSTCF